MDFYVDEGVALFVDFAGADWDFFLDFLVFGLIDFFGSVVGVSLVVGDFIEMLYDVLGVAVGLDGVVDGV